MQEHTSSKGLVMLGCDHAGFELKETVKQYLENLGYEVKDYGTTSKEPCDFPPIAEVVGNRVLKERALGVLICGSGHGMAMAANKIDGVRAASCESMMSVRAAKEALDINILCLGGRLLSTAQALSIVETWLGSDFAAQERYLRRLREVEDIESRY